MPGKNVLAGPLGIVKNTHYNKTLKYPNYHSRLGHKKDTVGKGMNQGCTERLGTAQQHCAKEKFLRRQKKVILSALDLSFLENYVFCPSFPIFPFSHHFAHLL